MTIFRLEVREPKEYYIVSKGTRTGSRPPEAFAEAIRHAAAGIIMLHNHPSGDPQSNREDKAVTTRLKEAGDILGIRVLILPSSLISKVRI